MLNFNKKKYVSFDNLKSFNGLLQSSLKEKLDGYKSEVDTKVQKKFNELSGKVQTDSEVIDARKGEASLRAKIDVIDDDIKNVSSQLEHIKNNQFINIMDYANLVIDDSWTNAIRKAIEECPKGWTVLFPPNPTGYNVKNVDSNENYLFKITKPIKLNGCGNGGSIVLDNISNKCDIFVISPSSEPSKEGYYIDNISIIGKDNLKYGNNAIVLDTQLEHQKISRSYIKNCFLYATNGFSIYLNNPTNSDGFFTSTIESNLIYSGIKLVRCGDSVNILKNTITGDKGVDISMVDGSNTLVFSENNVTAKKGFILRSGHNVKVINNNFELGYNDSVYENNAIVDFDGEEIKYNWGLLACEFIGNNITYRTTTNTNPNALRINKCRGLVVRSNHITQKNSKTIDITNKANYTIIDYNLLSTDNTLSSINDLGVDTVYSNFYCSGDNGITKYQRYGKNINEKMEELNTEVNNINKSYSGDIINNNLIWENTTFKPKERFTTQQVIDGVKQDKKLVYEIYDGIMSFDTTGFILRTPGGVRYKISLNSDGTLKTTIYE